MVRARFMTGMVAGVLALVALAAGIAWRGTSFSGTPTAPPPPPVATLAGLGAEVLFLDATDIVRRGSPRVIGVRFNGGGAGGSRVELVPHHFASEGLGDPVPIDDWADHLHAPVVFNAGQFDENGAHLGWLKQDGTWLVPAKHPAWQALLLSGPTDGAAWARIADLDEAPDQVTERYKHAVQSMMLLDDRGRVRVRETDKTACRTVVAEDSGGRVVVLVSEGAVTLAEFARWLERQPLGIVRAMNLDGGVESEIAIRTGDHDLTFFGQFGTGTTALEASSGMRRAPLPAVIAVRLSPATER